MFVLIVLILSCLTLYFIQCYRRSKVLKSVCLLLYIVMPSLNKMSYLILYLTLVRPKVLGRVVGRGGYGRGTRAG